MQHSASTKDSSTQQNDRERHIQTGREGKATPGATGNVTHQQSGGLARRGAFTPAFGFTSEPFALMQRMAEDMDRLFQQFGFGRSGLTFGSRLPSLFDDDLWSGTSTQELSQWTPQVETFRRGDQLVVRADIPGVKKEDVHVEIDNDVLTITGERRDEHEENRDGFFRSERSYGRFYRAIPLPEGANADQCNASFENGVLEVTLSAPKQEGRKARKIAVR